MAHGLVLRMHDMVQFGRSDEVHNEQGTAYVECNVNSSTGDVNLIKSWIDAVEFPSNSKKADYLTLVRQTLLFMFSSKWSMYTDKGDLLCAIKYQYGKFPKITENISEIFNTMLEIFKRDPWKNSFFLWNDLFDGTVTIYDKRVQDYFQSEPEEVVLARVHAIVLRKRASDAMCLAKTSFLYHSRIAKSFRSSRRRNSAPSSSTSGHASIDWFLFILQKVKRSLDSIVNEVRQLECHEGVEILYRLWKDPKNKQFCYTLLKILILQDLIKLSKYCCTKRLFKIFCMMHEELHSSPKEIAESCHKLISKHASSSAHFYLLVDVLWRQFGMKCLDLYVNLYVRGLTADINHLENQRHLGAFSDAESLETHIAAILTKLSTMFRNLNPSVARECMFSAFSLRPTKERLFMLQGLSQSLSNSNKNIHKSLLAFDFSTNCNCGLRCIGHCRDALNKSSFNHPLLSSSSIGNISYVVKRDFISVLENVRCVTFQYNVFDWRYNIGDLANYLSSYSREATLEKSGSDTESGEEICESDLENTRTLFETANDLECQFQCSSVKRKSDSDCSNETSPLNTEENITVQSDDFTSKRMKTAKPNVEMSVTVSSNSQQVIQGFFNNSLENVIRMSLNNNSAKSWSDSMNLLKGNKEPIINDLNSSKIDKTENAFQSCTSERSIPNNQKCIESNSNLSMHYSDKTHLQISASLQYDHTQQSSAVAPGNNTSFKEIDSSKYPNILKSHLVQKSSANVSDFTATQPTSEKFSSNIFSPKHERCSSQEMTNLHFAAKSDRERHVHDHHLHSSPFVSSQPPPKSFSKHQFKIHSLSEVKTEIVTTLPSQEVKECVPYDNTRKSVIVNVKRKSLQIANQSTFSVKPSAIHQNGNNLQKKLIHVNVPNKYLMKPDIAVHANLIIPRKSSSASANESEVESVPELIVPGIMAPPSMIKNSPWNKTVQNHAKPFFSAKISDSTPSSDLPKVSSKPGKMPLKLGSDLVLKRNVSNESEFGTPISKPIKEFKELSKNNLQHTIANKRMAYSSTQQLDNSLDSKLKWKMGQAHDSSRSQMTFHPISDSYNAPVSTSCHSWYASSHPKTSSNSPMSFSAHKMNTPRTISNSPVALPVHKINTPHASSNSPVAFSVEHVKIPKTNSNSPVSFSVHNMNSPQRNSNSPVPSSVYKMNTPHTGSNSPVSFSVQHMKIPKTNSNSPVSFSVQNMKTLESFGDKKVSTYPDANSHNYSSGNNVQNKLSVSFLKSRLTSVHNTQSYSHTNAYSYSNPNSFPAHDKAYSESHEPSQHQFDVKNIFERSTHSLVSSANITSNSISSSQIQSNSSSVYNPVFPANDRRVIVHEARNIATSSPSSNVQNIKSNAFSQKCCSPFEVNPCDTCSTKTSNQFLTKTQIIGFRSSPVEHLHSQVTDGISSDDKCFEVSQSRQQQTATEEPQKMCIFCSFLFPESLMKTHIENTHQEDLLNDTNYNIQNKETSFSVSNSEGMSITNYDSQNDNRMPLENNIHNACNTVLDIENSQNTDQFISTLLNIIDPNFDKSMEGSFENTGNSHPISANESPCDNSKSESLSEMFQGVDISSDLSAICDGNELSYDMIENKTSNGENVSNENKDIKSWYNNLSLDLLSNDDKLENEMVNFKISEYKPISSEISNSVPKNITNNEADLVDKQTSYEIFRTVEPLEQSNLSHNIQELDKIENFQNTSSQPLKNAIFCPICKKKLDFDVDMQSHINIYHPHISGDKMVCNKFNLSNNSENDERNGPKIVFTPCSFIKQENTAEIFDFDSYLPDNATKETYKPLQKGKPKLYSNSSCNSENSLMNIHENLNAQETECEIPANKKKGPRVTCIICNKVYSKNYIKIHNKKEHMKDQPSDCFKMSENSSNQSLSEQTAISSSTPEQNPSFPCNSTTLLQEDTDTRTCLSTSDALYSCNKFEGSNIKKTPYDGGNRTVQLDQKYPFHSISDSVKESSVSNLKFEKPSFTVLKGKRFDSKRRHTFNCKHKRTNRYQCNWSQNQNYCNQNFSSKLLLVKHLKNEHCLSYKCNWFQNNNLCNQEFPSGSFLLKHLKSEHMIKKSLECDTQLDMTQQNVPTLDRSQQLKENAIFCNSTNSEGSVFANEDLQETLVLKPKPDLLSVNLNHECMKVENNVNSDKAVSFSQNEHALPPEQVCPKDLNNQLHIKISEKDECHLSPKSVSHLFSISSVDESDLLLSVEKISSKQSDASNSVCESYEKSLNGNESSDLLDNFKESMHSLNTNSPPQKIYEKCDEVLMNKCKWVQNDSWCNQKFSSKSLLLKHLKAEDLKEKSFECDIQKDVSLLDRNQQMKENTLFYDSTNNKESVFVNEDMQETRVLKPKPDLPSVNFNHECMRLENNVNSIMQLNSDKAISFFQNEQALPSEQVCPENLDNQFYIKITEKNDSKCCLSPKSDSHLFSNFSVDDSDILSSVEKMSPKQSDSSNSVNGSCGKSSNKNESSDLLNRFEESIRSINSNNKGTVFKSGDLQETLVLKLKTDLPSENLNHKCMKEENNVNSVMHFNSDKAISFSQNEHALPPEQVCSEDLDNQLCNKIPEDEKCHHSPKSVSRLFSNSTVDKSNILLSVDEMSSKRSDASNSVNESCEKSLNKDGLSNLLNNFKKSKHEVNAFCQPQKVHERYDDFSDTKRSSQNDINSVHNSDLNENPSESYDFVTKDVDSDKSLLSLTGNSDSSSKAHNSIPDLFQGFEEINKLPARNEALTSKRSNKYEKVRAQNVCEIIGEEKHDNEVVNSTKSSNPKKLRCFISSKKLDNQASVKKNVEICDTSLLKNAQLNFRRELSLTNIDSVKCLASSALQLSCKELHAIDSVSNKRAIINTECTSIKQKAVQDSIKNQHKSHKRMNSVASDTSSTGKGNRPCKKKSKRKTNEELLLKFEKSSDQKNNCSRLTDLEMQVSSSPENSNSQIAEVNDKSSVMASPKNSHSDVNALNFIVNDSEKCIDNIIELNSNLDFQTQLTETYNVHKSISTNNVIDGKQYVKNNEPASSVTKRSNSLPSFSESDEKGMPNLVPEFDFQSLLVNEKFETDENTLGSEEDLKRSGVYCFPYEMPATGDVSCPTDSVVAVSSAGAHFVDNKEPFCVSSISSCSYPKVLTNQDSKENGKLSFLNEHSVFSSVDTFQNIINEVGSVTKSKSVSAEHSNDLYFNQKETSVIKSDTVNSFSVGGSGKNLISSDKDNIKSCDESMDSEKSVDNQLSEVKQLKKSRVLPGDISIFQGQPFEQEIKETVDDMVTYITSCENPAFLIFKNCERNECVESRMISSKAEKKTSSNYPVFVNSDCGENNLRLREPCNKKAFSVSYKTSNTKAAENSSVVCRECNKTFQSDEVLSDHLELIHDLPHLKKQISEFGKKSNVDKLSPPPLYFHSVDDYDSTSASAESSPNKYSEEDNCRSHKTAALGETSSAESELSLSELGSNIRLEQKSSKSIQSSSLVSQLSSDLKCKKEPNITRSRHQNEKHNKMTASFYSQKKKIGRGFSNMKAAPFSVVSDPLNKDLINKNAALPKCIIKVMKGEQNSVFYKIDNPLDKMSENNAQAECDSFDNPKYTDTNSNEAVFDHQSFESSINHNQVRSCPKLKKRFKRSCDPHSPGTSSDSVISKKNKELCKKINKNDVFSLLNNKKRTEQKVNNTVPTLKSKDIKQFLINNKQPYVLVTRLDDSVVKSSDASTLKPDFSYINFICKTPVVSVKRLKLPDDLDENKVHLGKVSVVVPRLPNEVEEKALETSSNLPSIKKCYVVLNRVQ